MGGTDETIYKPNKTLPKLSEKKDGCRPCAREVGQNRPNYYLKELLPVFRKVEPRLVAPQRFVVDDVSRHPNSVNLSYHPRVHHML